MVWKTWKSQGISFSDFAGHPVDIIFISDAVKDGIWRLVLCIFEFVLWL